MLKVLLYAGSVLAMSHNTTNSSDSSKKSASTDEASNNNQSDIKSPGYIEVPLHEVHGSGRGPLLDPENRHLNHAFTKPRVGGVRRHITVDGEPVIEVNGTAREVPQKNSEHDEL